MPPQAPSASPRFAGGDGALRMVSVSGMTIAPPRPWTRAGDVERVDARRERGGGRAEREDPEADDEHAPPAEAVAERGAREEQHGEGERVRVDGPFELLERGVEIGRITGSAVVTTRLSSETMKSASEVIANVQSVCVCVSSILLSLCCDQSLTQGEKKRGRHEPSPVACERSAPIAPSRGGAPRARDASSRSMAAITLRSIPPANQ